MEMYRWSNRIKETVTLALVLGTGIIATADNPKSAMPKSFPAPAVRSAARMVVFVPVRQRDSVKLVEQTLSVPSTMNPYVAAIGYLARPGGVLPKGTTVRNLTLENGVLQIELSPEIKRFRGGSSDEALLLAALSATVARFDGVKAFQLTVQNRPLSVLGGHADLSEPYPAARELPEDFR